VLKKPTDLLAAKRKDFCMSSYRVHVTSEMVKISGYTPEIKGKSYAKIRNRDLIPSDSGGFYADFYYWEEIPEEMKNIIICVTSLERMPLTPFRERGIYEFATAEAVVDYYDNDHLARGYKIEGRAEKPEDLKILDQRIRAGTILPEPRKNYDAEQVGKVVGGFKQFFDRFFNWALHPDCQKR
jgi:hypothetical protein